MKLAIFNEAHERGGGNLFSHGAYVEDGRGAHGNVALQVLPTESFQVNVAFGAGGESNNSGDLPGFDELTKLSGKRCGG
jgi:hypothetical protein